MEDAFKIENFNVIKDENNYYFFRALNNEDNEDYEKGIITDEKGNIQKIRTDRERCKDNTKYDENSILNLEQVYDHVKMNHRKDTNCISLSVSAKVSISYGMDYHKDRYIIVKIPKKNYGKLVINAGQYMLEEIDKKVNESIASINDDNLVQKINRIENTNSTEELIQIISQKYITKEKIQNKKHKLKKEIMYMSPIVRMTNYGILNEKQTLEKNKIIAKLTLLERNQKIEPIIPNTTRNDLLIRTIKNAFTSLEFLHYGIIKKEEIINIPKEVVYLFDIMQNSKN